MNTDFDNQMKIRIFQPIVPEYRVALFEGVGKRYGENVEIWASAGSGQDKSYPLQHMRYDYDHPFKKIGPFVWQRGLSLRDLTTDFHRFSLIKRLNLKPQTSNPPPSPDVVVVCGDVHQLSSLWIALKAKILGIKVVWWGHHKTATSTEWSVRIRLAVARLLSDVFLCYTRTGIQYLEAHGFKRGRVFATGNTIDQEPIKAAIQAFTSKPTNTSGSDTCFKPRINTDLHGCEDKATAGKQTSNSSPASYLLCVGVLREKIHLDMFLKAMTDPRLAHVNLVVIGDGPMKEPWQKLATDLGIADRITWLPGTRDQMVMAPWFLGAKAFIYPGSIGLSILHSFSYGLPVVTHGNAEHQMPEFEVMEDGKTGVCFTEGNLEDMIQKTAGLLADEQKRLEMAEYCQLIAFNRYSMSQMVENYCAALEAVA